MHLDFRKLALLKIRALTHDPPNKSFLIKILKEKPDTDFRELHEKVAGEFRERVVEKTRLYGIGLERELEEVVNNADKFASSFDRWILRISEWPEKSYVYYDYIHNPFNPVIKHPLKDVDSQSIQRVLEKINRVIRDLKLDGLIESAPEGELLVYNAIYILLEATWYAEGLSPSLADTRVPTHTVFDHLYATATVVNMVIPPRSSTLQGYLVVVDYPGVQGFVNSGRKTGDLWASSWLLSNLMWSVASHFGLRYGYDVIVNPTPRLNPYAVRSFIANVLSIKTGINRLHLEYNLTLDYKKTIQEYSLEDIKTPIENIMQIYSSVYGLENPEDFANLWLQPIIPATILMILPRELPGKSQLEPEDVIREVLEVYNNSWKAIKDFVVEKIKEKSSGKPVNKLVLRLLEEYSGLLDTPPQLPRIAIVDLARVYDGIKSCLLEEIEDLCSELGISKEFVERVRKEFKSEDIPGVAGFLLWHVVFSRWRLLSTRGFGVFHASIPRPFWYMDDTERLKPVASGIEAHQTGWIQCSTCGDEPAVLVTRKRIGQHREAVFSKDTLDFFKEITGSEFTEGDIQEIQKIIKPGETLGPYCFFKRTVYLVFRDKLDIASTDDIALLGISVFMSKLDRGVKDKLVDTICKNVNWSACREVVEYLFSPSTPQVKLGRDMVLTATSLGRGYEEFRSELTEALRKACYEVFSGNYEVLLDKIVELFGLNGVPLEEPIRELISIARREELESRRRELTRRICNLFSLRDVYAIIRGDADFIGEVLSGKRLAKPSELLDTILKSIGETGGFIGVRERVLESLKKGYERAIRILGGDTPLISPSTSHAVSLSLMLTAVEDWKRLRSRGILVYSGGDDVYGLTPIEYSLLVTLELRGNFYSEGFKKLRGQPVAPEIPTGRSFSVRFARLMDCLLEEASTAVKILEEDSKSSIWAKHTSGFENVEIKRKDALTISSSICGVCSTIPLHQLDHSSKLALQTALATPFLLLTLLSSNIPEDLENYKIDIVTSDPRVLSRIALHVFSRNIIVGGESVKKKIDENLNNIIENTVDLYVLRDRRASSVIEELIELIRVLRVVV